MTIQERLQIVLKMHNLSASAFADKIGVQRSNMSHVLSGRNKPSLDFLEKTLQHFPRVNAKWLVCGQVDSEEDMQPEFMQANLQPSKKNNSERKLVKLVEIYSDGSFRELFPKNE
jgi:transcriptional regulator with XRE-family HTH domain